MLTARTSQAGVNGAVVVLQVIFLQHCYIVGSDIRVDVNLDTCRASHTCMGWQLPMLCNAHYHSVWWVHAKLVLAAPMAWTSLCFQDRAERASSRISTIPDHLLFARLRQPCKRWACHRSNKRSLQTAVVGRPGARCGARYRRCAGGGAASQTALDAAILASMKMLLVDRVLANDMAANKGEQLSGRLRVCSLSNPCTCVHGCSATRSGALFVLQNWRCEVWSRPHRTGTWMPPSACMFCARRRRCSVTASCCDGVQITSLCSSMSQHRRSSRGQGLARNFCGTSFGVAHLLSLQSGIRAWQALDVDEDACLLLDELLPMGRAVADARLRLHVAIKTEVWQGLSSVIALFLLITFSCAHYQELLQVSDPRVSILCSRRRRWRCGGCGAWNQAGLSLRMPPLDCLTARSRVTQQRSLALPSSSSCPMHCRVRAAAAPEMPSGMQAASWLPMQQPPGAQQVQLLEDSPST
jgi:hypothetical protein